MELPILNRNVNELETLYAVVGILCLAVIYVLHRLDMQTQRLLFLKDDLQTVEYRIAQLEQEIQRTEAAVCCGCKRVALVTKPFDKTLTGNFRKPQGAENYDC